MLILLFFRSLKQVHVPYDIFSLFPCSINAIADPHQSEDVISILNFSVFNFSGNKSITTTMAMFVTHNQNAVA